MADNNENPIIYYAIIILAIGLLAYKFWISKSQEIIHYSIILSIEFFIILWFSGLFIFIVRNKMFHDTNSRIISMIMLHITNVTIIILFFYRLIVHEIVSIFLIIHGTIAGILLVYYNYAIPRSLINFQENYKTKKSIENKIENELLHFINSNLQTKSLEELESINKSKQYPKKIWNKYRSKYSAKLEELKSEILLKHQEKEIIEIISKKQTLQHELESIRNEKENLLMDEESKDAILEYNLTHRRENVILSSKLTKKEKNILKKAKFKQVNEYSITDKKIINVFVRPVMSHSATHTFLVWSICRLLEDFDVTKITTHDTRDADITFIHRNKKYAIEVETGKLLKKERQIKNKVHALNNNYPNRWFFVVSNRNLQAQYSKYGLVTQRIRVSEIIQKMLEKTHPDK